MYLYRMASNNERTFNCFTAIINTLNAAVSRIRRRASGWALEAKPEREKTYENVHFMQQIFMRENYG